MSILKKLSLLVSLFFISVFVFSQNPQHVWGGVFNSTSSGVDNERALDIGVDGNGHTYVSCDLRSNSVDLDPNPNNTVLNTTDQYGIVKLDQNGHYLWHVGVPEEIPISTADNNSLIFPTKLDHQPGTFDYDPSPTSSQLNMTSSGSVVRKFDSNGNFV